MTKVEEIRKLRNNSSAIRNLFEKDIPLWKSSPSHYDKVGWGFNIDDRFKAFDTIQVWFSSYKGTYGDSGCSSQLSLDRGIFAKHFLSYLNKNKESIMLEIAKSIDLETATLKKGAEEELNKELEKLKEIDSMGENRE